MYPVHYTASINLSFNNDIFIGKHTSLSDPRSGVSKIVCNECEQIENHYNNIDLV